MSGGNPVHVAESMDPSGGGFPPVSLVELHAATRMDARRAGKRRMRISNSVSNAHARHG
jgi:hypothetical protein